MILLQLIFNALVAFCLFKYSSTNMSSCYMSPGTQMSLRTFFFSLEESMSCCFTICELLHIIVYLLLKNIPKEKSLKGLEKKN